MPRRRRLFRLVVVAVAAAALAASCGGDDGGRRRGAEGRSDPDDPCPNELPIRASRLPTGFDADLKEGPAPGQDNLDKVRIWHYEGPEGKIIEVFRGGQRHKFTKGTPIRALDTIARVKAIEGGYAAKMRLGRGRCSRYVLEARGLNEQEMRSVVSGLRRGRASPG